jgi:hypothetical protein
MSGAEDLAQDGAQALALRDAAGWLDPRGASVGGRQRKEVLIRGLGIPIAAGVLYPIIGIQLSPMIAAAAMAA